MKLYRVMKVGRDGKPLVGTRRNMLGVRPTDPTNADPRRRLDVAAVTDADDVYPGEGLSTESVPDNLTVGPREALFEIESDDLPAELEVRPDRPPRHLIGPAARMTLADLQAALASTRDLWDRVQSGTAMLTLDAVRAAVLDTQPWTGLDELVRAELAAGRLVKQVHAELKGMAEAVWATPGITADGEDAFGDTLDALIGHCAGQYAYTDPPAPVPVVPVDHPAPAARPTS